MEGHPPVVAISRSYPVETLRQYNLTQRREDKKKMLAQPVIVQSYFGNDAPVTVIPHRNSNSIRTSSPCNLVMRKLKWRMKNILTALRLCVEHQNWYGAITIALTLPDICGSIDAPGINNSKERAVAWFNQFVGQAYRDEVGGVECVFMTGGDYYALRCAYLHQGSFDVSGQNAREVVEKFIMHHSVAIRIHKVRNNGKLVIDISTFCEDIAKGVETWEAEVRLDPENRRRALIESLMPLHLPDVHHGNMVVATIGNLFE